MPPLRRANRPSPGSPRRLPVRAVLGVVVALAAAGLLAAWWFSAPRVPQQGSQQGAPPGPAAGCPAQGATADALPPGRDEGGYRVLVLRAPPTNVHDGDTFTADLDADGRIAKPCENVRLLFVDTPELGQSWKGQDVSHGLPARDYLADLLRHPPLELRVPLDRPRGSYGRTLARVRAAGQDVNLALIRAGHSPFDTRFGFPPPADYAAYSAAEGEAFDARRGIWADAASRERYLARLQREHRTPAARSNPLYVPAPQEAPGFRAAAYLGRYVRLRGTLASVRRPGHGVRLLRLRGAQDGQGRPLGIVAFGPTAERLGLERWPRGATVIVEGFVQTYQGRLELLLHYGAASP
jgi:endonuclease YncB( thermonuclease family)